VRTHGGDGSKYIESKFEDFEIEATHFGLFFATLRSLVVEDLKV